MNVFAPIFVVPVAAMVGAIQARLLRGHVRAPRRWFAIALADGILSASILLVRGPSVPPTAPTYLLLGWAALVVAVAQWRLVLRPDVPRAAAWVPITLAATAAAWLLPSTIGLGALDAAGVLVIPVVQATGLVYLLGNRATPIALEPAT